MTSVSSLLEKSKPCPIHMERLNKVWYIMLMNKITAIVKLREGNNQTRMDFENTWNIFLDCWANANNRKKDI